MLQWWLGYSVDDACSLARWDEPHHTHTHKTNLNLVRSAVVLQPFILVFHSINGIGTKSFSFENRMSEWNWMNCYGWSFDKCALQRSGGSSIVQLVDITLLIWKRKKKWRGIWSWSEAGGCVNASKGVSGKPARETLYIFFSETKSGFLDQIGLTLNCFQHF